MAVKACPRCGTAARLRCSRCKSVWYCSSKCQAASWKEHRAACEAKLDAPTVDDEDLALKTFERVEPKCGVCGADAPGEAWTRYRPCCGKRACEACEIKITGRDKAAEAAAMLGHSRCEQVDGTDEPTPCAFCGELVEDPTAKARERAEAGDVEARFALGVALARSDNPEQGIAWLRRAARAGHYGALHELGRCYATGKKPDHAKAAVNYRRAAAHGNVRALHDLALAHYEGKGMKKDVKEALRLLEMAAQSGDPQSQKALAKMCIDGTGMDVDREKAARLMGLPVTAELIREGKCAPSFLFRDNHDEKTAFVKDEYTEAEMDDFFGDDDDYETRSSFGRSSEDRTMPATSDFFNYLVDDRKEAPAR